jgi:hypothetical protein
MDLFHRDSAESDRVAAGGGLASESEQIEVIEMPLHDLSAAIDAATDFDMKLLALMQTLRVRRPDLFV